MTMLKIDDYKLHFEYHFTDPHLPTLLLIHELCLDGSMWDRLISHWESDFNVVTYDMFGHGLTTDSEKKATSFRLLKELSVLIHTLHLKHIHLVGAHAGGLLAILAARTFPDSIVSLSLLSVPYFYPKDILTRSYQEMTRIYRADRALLPRIWAATSVFPVTRNKTNYIARAFRRLKGQTFLDLLNLCHAIIRSRDFALMDEFKSLNVPVLILICEKNLLVPKELHMVFSTFVPNSSVFVVPETSWLMALDRPGRVADLVRSFIIHEQVTLPMPLLLNPNEAFADMRETLQAALSESMNKRQHVLEIQSMEGHFRVMWNQQEVPGEWRRRHAMELIIYLAVHHGVAGRDQIIDALLPDLPVDVARQHLRVRLSHLRKIFHNHSDPAVHHLLVTTRSAVSINGPVTCDVLDFFNYLKRLQNEETALAVRTGRFFHVAALYHPGCLDYIGSQWLEKEISRAIPTLAGIMSLLVHQIMHHGDKLLAMKVLKAGRPFESVKQGTAKKK